MSALPPKADMCSALAHVCFGRAASSSPRFAVPPAACCSPVANQLDAIRKQYNGNGALCARGDYAVVHADASPHAQGLDHRERVTADAVKDIG
jgi:hypothetical protein